MRLRLSGRSDAGTGRRSTRQAGLVLVYHRVAQPAGDATHDLVPALDPRAFEEQLDHVQANYWVVPPSQILDAVLARRPGERFPIAITFDDDLPSHAEVVAPALERAGLPAAFFLCGASLDGPHRFWWEDLQTLMDRGFFERGTSISSEVDFDVLRHDAAGAIHAVAERIERLSPERRDEIAADLRAHAGMPAHALGAAGIKALIAAGFEIGFHTRHHYLLPTLDDAALADAMNEGRDRLEGLAGRRLTMIAYPHGKADERISRAARAAGFALGFTGGASPVLPTTDPLLIGRLDAQSVPAEQFGHVVAATFARG